MILVEDDARVREAIERLLDIAGFECSAFDSAEALLAQEPQASAACIVSDLRLPAMSGLELLDRLRLRGDRTPLVLVTAHDVPGLRDEALRMGAAAYLAKPFRGTALLDAIRRVAAPVPLA